jgi:hypothetical protein
MLIFVAKIERQYIMKKIINLLMMCLPLLVQAQTEAKYLAGGVPTEEGKVVFRTQMQVSALGKSDLYQTALKWAGQRFITDEKFSARVVYADTLEGKIAVYGDEYMVFSNSALSLDRTRVNYQFQMNVSDGNCEAILSRIRYTYHDNEKNPDKYTAEEWITDGVALNKAQTKLIPICGKFRRKTIDLKDELFKGLQNAFGDRLIEIGAQAAPVKPADLVTVATLDHLMVTAGDDEQFKLAASAWGGESQMFGKDVTFVFIDTQKTAANLLMVDNNHYTIELYREGEATPYRSLVCVKLSAQQVSGAEATQMNAALDATKTYNMFVGEIKNK